MTRAWKQAGKNVKRNVKNNVLLMKKGELSARDISLKEARLIIDKSEGSSSDLSHGNKGGVV